MEQSMQIDVDGIKIGVVPKEKSPFANLLDMVKAYLNMAKEKDPEKLYCFANWDEDEPFFPEINNFWEMYRFIVKQLFESSSPTSESLSWLNFDERELDDILKDDFFSEYNKARINSGRKYPYLEVYTYAKLQAIALSVIPDDASYLIKWVWCDFEDFITVLYDLHFYGIIAEAYKAKGIHWFALGGDTDPIRYKWACIAAIACQKSGKVEAISLIRDLNDIYQDMLITWSVSGSLAEKKEIVEFTRSCIDNANFDNARLMAEKLKKLEEEKEQLSEQNTKLSEEKEKLEAAYEWLVDQIKNLHVLVKDIFKN